jgi:hypothetical protein
VAEGEGVGEASLFFLVVSFLVVSFLVVSVDDFLVVSVDVFLVVVFLVVDVLAGAFSGAVVAVVSVLLVQEAMSPAANMAVME